MRIAMFDYRVIPTSPTGSCILRIISGLADEHEFTVFAVDFDNPRPDRVRWVRIPAPRRPLVLLFVWYMIAASLAYAYWIIVRRLRFDVVLGIECYVPFADIAYAHFCHRSYLRLLRQMDASALRPRSLRGFLRWCDHRLRAIAEPWVYERVRSIVVPSRGLQRELETTYPYTTGRIRRIANLVDVASFKVPANFERRETRARLGAADSDVLLAFVALGHFERKGLPVLLDALRQAPEHVRLVVVGGEKDLVGTYQRRCKRDGVAARVTFVGMQNSIQPFLWAADSLVLPTRYETFSLVVLQAGAAGVIPIVTPVNGVEEYITDGVNGFIVNATADSVAAGIRRLCATSQEERVAMRASARAAAGRYTPERFIDAWRSFFSTQPYLTAADNSYRGGHQAPASQLVGATRNRPIRRIK